MVVEDAVFPGLNLEVDDNPDDTRIALDDLLFALDYWINAIDLEWLKSQAQDGMVKVSLLRVLGLELRYDEATGKISVNVPEHLRRPRGMDGKTDYNELFEQVFSKKKPAASNLKVGLWVDGKQKSQVRVKIASEARDIQVEADPLVSELRKWVSSDRLDRIRGREEEGMIKLEALWQAGVLARYEEALLRVDIRIPAEYQAVQVKSLSGRDNLFENEDALGPSFLSGYVNATASEQVQFTRATDGNSRFDSLNSAFDGAVNVGSLVFEGQAFYGQQDRTPWRRGDVRLVKDFPSMMLRFAAGDLSSIGTGYFRALPVGGVGLSTQFGTRPTAIVTALSHHEVEIKVQSTVNIYRNGILLQSLDLRPGKYDLRDLPLLTGENELVIEVIDPSGRKETINFSQFYNSSFLAPGVSQLSYNVGYPWQQEGAHRVYDRTRPTYMFSHRIGIFNELTAGAFLERDHAQSVYGGNVLFPLFWGALRLDAAKNTGVADGSSTGGGFAYRGLYSYVSNGSGASRRMRSFTLGAEKRTAGFAYFGDLLGTQYPDMDFFGMMTQSLSSSLSASVLGGYGIVRSTQDPGADGQSSYRVSLGMNRAFDRGTAGNLTIGYLNRPGYVEASASIYVTFTVPEKQQNLRAAYDSSSDRTVLGWYQNAKSTVGSTKGRLEVQRDPTGRSVNGSIGYIGNRGDIELQQRFSDSVILSDTRVTAHAAFVFAGLRAGFSRRVSDSFALVELGRAQSGADILVNPLSDGTYFAKNDWLGGPVLSNLGSYFQNRVYLDSPENANLPNSLFHVKPTYRSGVLISLASDNDLVVRVRLVTADGKPLERVSGELVERDRKNDDQPGTPFFTNRAGLFQSEGLHEGEYEIHFYDDKWEDGLINVPDDATRVIDMGSLIVKQAAPKKKEEGEKHVEQ